MKSWLIGLTALALGAGEATAADTPGLALLDRAFDPAQLFAGELRSGTSDEVVFTARTYLRDNYVPDYALAVAYRCVDLPDGKTCEGRYTVRTLRVGTGEARFDKGYKLWGNLRDTSRDQALTLLDGADLQWLEAELWTCPGGIDAYLAVGRSAWGPDLHFGMRQEQSIIVHPAALEVTMKGDVTQSSYRGWVLAQGLPAAMKALVETLDKCWKPATAVRPWRR